LPGGERRLRLELVAAGALAAASGIILPGEGNLSARCAGGFLVTPAGADKGRLAPAGLLFVDLEGRGMPGGVSSEARLHAAIYRRFPSVGAVVHAHPPEVLLLSSMNRSPDVRLTAIGRAELGTVSWVGFEPPGSDRLAEAVAAALVHAPACVLDQHGAVTVGPSVETALRRMLLLERLAALTPEGGGR